MPRRRKRLGYTVIHPGVARLQFILSEAHAADLAALAKAEGKSISSRVADFVRQALADYDTGARTLIPAGAERAKFQPDVTA